MSKESPSYYAIVPANVRYSDIPDGAKLLFGEITALCNQEGCCWASNAYFARLYKKSPDTISRWISDLVEAGFVNSQINQAQGNRRELWIAPIRKNAGGVSAKKPIPIGKNADTPIRKNADHNNTSTNSTINTTYNNSAEINSAIPEIPFESKPKEKKGTPGAEPWTKEIATLFDRVNLEESKAAGIDHVAFNWEANRGMNFGALANIKKVLITDIKAKNNIPDDHTLKISFEHIFRCGFRLLLDNANGVGGLFSFTPMKIYKKYDDIKSFAHRGRQVKRTKSDIINEQRAKAIYEIATDDSEPGLFDY